MHTLTTRTIVMMVIAGAGMRQARADDHATNAVALINKADLIYQGTTSAAVFAMHIKTRSYERDYDVVMWDDSRHGDRALVKILGPALWRGFGTLKIGDSLKLYDPNSNRVTVVGQSMLGDSWMGSHFSNDDLVKDTHLAMDYDVKEVQRSDGKLGERSGTYHEFALTPKPTAPVVWGRIVYRAFEAGDVVLPVRAEYFRKFDDRQPVRTIAFDDVAELGGRTIPRTMTITVTAKPGEATSITYKTIKFDVALPDEKFTEQALRR